MESATVVNLLENLTPILFADEQSFRLREEVQREGKRQRREEDRKQW